MRPKPVYYLAKLTEELGIGKEKGRADRPPKTVNTAIEATLLSNTTVALGGIHGNCKKRQLASRWSGRKRLEHSPWTGPLAIPPCIRLSITQQHGFGKGKTTIELENGD
jgi:hypothetical protein